MKIKPLVFSTFLLSIVINLILSANPAWSQNKSDNRVFLCKEIFDEASKKRLPATLVWMPELKKHRRIMVWKSNYSRKLTPQEKCETVSPRFQKFYDTGTLKYLTNGKVKGYPVICAVEEKRQKCNSKNILFQLKSYQMSRIILYKLVGILKNYSSQPLYQNSGSRIYVPMDDLLNKPPVTKVR